MKQVEKYTENIAQHFACLIEYGTNDGVYTDEEVEKCTEWVNAWNDLHPNCNIVFSYGDESFFSQCDILRLGATCIECTITVLEN